jgi:putative aldouronate transport system substrate-binding protein
MKNKVFAKAAPVSLALALTGSLLAACSSGQTASPGTDTTPAAPKVEAPTEISFMVPFHGTEPIDNNNLIWKEVEKRTNTKLSITFVPNSNYEEKFSVTLASGSMPDVIVAGSPLSSNVMKTAMGGAFWEIGSYIKDYPNLAKFPEVVWLNTKYPDGKNYVLPKPRPTEAGPNFDYRQDWLEKLGLKVPETLDDVHKTLKAFVEQDPDGNGQKDTIGLVPFISSDGTTLGNLSFLLSAAFGNNLGSTYFQVKDGALQTALAAPEMKKAIGYLSTLYADGLIHKDFATMKQQQVRSAGMGGKVGAITENIPGSWVVTEGLRKVDPKGTFVSVPYLVADNGNKIANKGAGYTGAFLIKKQGVDEAKLKKILTFFNDISSEELYELANYGFKDTHFTKNGDIYVQTPQAKTDLVGTIFMGTVSFMYDKYFYAYNAPNIPLDAIEVNKKLLDEQAKVSTPSPLEGLVSETWGKYGKEFDKKVTDKIIKTIVGSESLDTWDDFAAKLVDDANYKKALAELQAAYKVRMGK